MGRMEKQTNRSVREVLESRGMVMERDEEHDRMIIRMAKGERKRIRRETQRRVRESTGGLCCEPTCQKPGTMQCIKCRQAIYCSAECQKTHWYSGGHKAECKKLRAAMKDTLLLE